MIHEPFIFYMHESRLMLRMKVIKRDMHALSPTRKPIAKCLGRNYKRAFVKHSFKSPGILKHFLLRINKVIRN